MSTQRIVRWYTGTVIWEGEAESVNSAIHAALATQANLTGADLSGADLSGANLSGANLSGANLRGANLSGANLMRANLSEANLMRANLWGANLAGADLAGADLAGADLSGADLSGADLSGADLSGANLSGANLRWANLRWADLSGADLSGANLSGANLRGANLSEADGVDAARCTPLLMLLDQPGMIRAYKLVTAQGVGPFNGGLTYQVGDSYEVTAADTDVREQCAAGIHVATLDWCLREWRDGYRVLIVEFCAADIAAIPTATDGKFRLHRCRVVGEKDIRALVAAPAPQEA